LLRRITAAATISTWWAAPRVELLTAKPVVKDPFVTTKVPAK